jgi:Abnormal spindle-like microcephaly-assoc'd, ASPM-SPD-2-Hydin
MKVFASAYPFLRVGPEEQSMKYGHAQAVGIRVFRLRKNPREFWLLVLLAAVGCVLPFLSGCAGFVASAKQQTTTSASFQLTPSTINFGQVVVGKPATQVVTLSNTGNISVNITQMTLSDSHFSIAGLAMPTSLAVSQSATFTVAVNATSAGGLSATLTVQGDSGSTPVVVKLSASAVNTTTAQPGLTLSPPSFNFGSVVDGQTKSQTITVSNPGTATLTVESLSVSGSAYSVSGLTTPATVPVGGSVTFSVLFAPTISGALSGTISVASDAPNSPNVLALSGTGTAATVTVTANPASLTFAKVNAGSSSSQTVTISNTGNTAVTLSQITVTAKNFQVSGLTTPVNLAVGQNAPMTVSFSPTAAENVTGNITLLNSAGTSTVIAVSGSAIQPALTITPPSANFGNVTVGSPATQTFQFTNSGTAPLTVTQVSVAGSGFSIATLSLPITLNPGQPSTFNVEFDPATAGSATGNLSVVSNAPNSPAAVALSGTGIAPTRTLSFSATSIAFGNVTTGSSASQNIGVTNTGNASVTISQISLSGAAFALSGATTPVTLTAGQNMTFGVTFAPTAAATDTGAVAVVSNATGSPASIALSGTGVPPVSHSVALSWIASTSTVSGYNVYRSNSNGSGYAKLNSSLVPALTYQDSSVDNGTTYYYVVTAVDSSGDESAYSNQASAVIP